MYSKNDLSKFESVRLENLQHLVKSITFSINRVINDFYKSFVNETDYLKVYVTIENVTINGTSNTLNELFGLNYLMRNELSYNSYMYNISDIISVAPTANKRFATGRGDADKDLVIYCFKLSCDNENIYNIEKCTKIDDIADAFFMSDYGLFYKKNIRLLKKVNIEKYNTKSKKSKMTKTQQDALKNVFDDNMKKVLEICELMYFHSDIFFKIDLLMTYFDV